MELEEIVRDAVVCRKRRESNGGSSDSDVSEGWNIVDHSDTNSPDAPSSDGESVEVIEAEEESSLQDADSDKEVLATETSEPVTETALVSANELPSVALPPVREEMFDSSFCWFLATASMVLLCSQLALLAAESVLTWNSNPCRDSPSFLKDLPITPKPLCQKGCAEKISWAKDENVIVIDSVDDNLDKASDKTIIDKSSTVADEKLQKIIYNNVEERPNVLIDNQDFVKYFKVLSDMSISDEAQKKFVQSMLILDALQIGIQDLEGAVAENSELKMLLKKQKHKLNDVLNEVKFGVSRSMDRLATNVLSKVEMLERRFGNQWCKLEKNGHKEELKILFYDCDESNHDDKTDFRSDKKKHIYKSKSRIDANKKKDKHRKTQMILDNYKYEVDKDSTGKVFSKEINDNGGNNEYYKLVKDGKKNKEKHKPKDSFSHDKINTGFSTTESNKENHFMKEGKKNKQNHKYQDAVSYDKTEKRLSEKESKKENHFMKEGKKYKENHNTQYFVDYDKTRNKLSAKKNQPNKQLKENIGRKEKHPVDSKDIHYEKPVTKKSAEEVLGRLFKERCTKILKNHNSSTNLKEYHKLKEEVDKKLKISKELFDHLYFKFCKQNLGDDKENSKHKRGHIKSDNNDNIFKKDINFRNNELVIEDPYEQNLKFKVIESLEVSKYYHADNNVVELAPLQEWATSYEIPSSNKSDIDGYWFFKAGESRSHVRWFHQRSDWWFDRASQRRHTKFTYPHPSSWYMMKRNNWFFRRAWARQQCRVSPNHNWCHLGDEAVTVSNANVS